MSFNEVDLAVLKTLISDRDKAIEFVHENDEKLFSTDLWNFARQVTSYIRCYKDVPTLQVLLDKFKKQGNEQAIDNIREVWGKVESTEHFTQEYGFNVDKLKQRFAEKTVSQLTNKLNNRDQSAGIDTAQTIKDLQSTINTIKGISGSKTFESKSIKDYLPQFAERFNAKKENPDFDTGIKTGYSFFDYATNGLKDADYVLIAGESGFGKSLLLNNMAVQVWLQNNRIDSATRTEGKDIIYFSLEMPYEDCFIRLLARLSGVSSRSIENAKLSKEELAKVKQACDFIKNYEYDFHIVDIVDASASDLEAILEDGHKKYGAIFVDYLGIMKPNAKSEEADWLKQGTISYELRGIARKYKVPMFSAVQLNRKSDSKNSSDNIGLNRLARSATIATHATHVLQIESRENEQKHSDMSLHLIKNRKGPKLAGKLIKNLAAGTLLDIPMEVEESPDLDDQFTNLDDISEDAERLDF